MKYLIFQIYAPLISWGDIAVRGERRSYRNPSKSAMLGLISAALGIKRDEEALIENLTQSLGFSMKLYSPGFLIKDFHTVQVPKKEKNVYYHTRRAELNAKKEKIGTVLSSREYRCDSYSLIAVFLKNDKCKYGLEEISDKIKKPVFHIYFGRKSCPPAMPLAPVIVDASNIKEAFLQYGKEFPNKDVLPLESTEAGWKPKIFREYYEKTLFSKDITYFWEDDTVTGFDKEVQSVEMYDQPISRKRWQFTSRREYMAIERREEK